jgi:hypothetical protein
MRNALWGKLEPTQRLYSNFGEILVLLSGLCLHLKHGCLTLQEKFILCYDSVAGRQGGGREIMSYDER